MRFSRDAAPRMSNEIYTYKCRSCRADAGHAPGATKCEAMVARGGKMVKCGGTLDRVRVN